ncbi:TPA: ead/Ea22-like family protein [Escherichia coli]
MTKINYQALREAAERAIPAMERLLMLPVDDDLISEQELKDYGVDIDALNAFKFLAGPETVLALLDELEAKDKRIADMEAREVVLPRAHDVHPLGPQSAKIFCEFHRSIVNRCADEIRKVGVKVSIKGN